MKRIPLFAGNWKMNKTVAEAESFIEELIAPGLPGEREYLIAASPTLLPAMVQAIGDAPIKLAAQNMFFEEQGAFTGEVSPLQLLDIGVSYVLVGHSERRHIFGEDDELIKKKLISAEKHRITPVFCIGETLDQRQAGEAAKTVLSQLRSGLSGLTSATIEQMVIAYEPVWAIGTGKIATAEEAEEMHALLRAQLPESTRIIYGGSVKPENCQALIGQPSIDGFLVGGASLEMASFRKIFSI